jgi:hypothetical protein
MVHYNHLRLLKICASSLKIGGYCFLETIGGQGGNYLALPKLGAVKAIFDDAFEFRYFKEHRVGPANVCAAATKLLAVKRYSLKE